VARRRQRAGLARNAGAVKFFDPDTASLSKLIKEALVGALLLSSFAILIYPVVTGRGPHVVEPAHVAVRRLPTLLLGLVLGSIVTLTSVGAGAIGVVILTLLYPTLMTRRLIGTDVVHAVPLTLISGLGHMSIGNTSFPLLGLLLVGSIPGIAIGTRLTGRLPDRLLRICLALILCFAAYQLAQKI
jgi:uncharacterized membrane protein YfcA